MSCIIELFSAITTSIFQKYLTATRMFTYISRNIKYINIYNYPNRFSCGMSFNFF